MPEIAFNQNDANNMARFLHTIGNPLRLKILYNLIDKHCCVCDLSSILHQRQPCISQHLMVLREEGLVDFHQDGWNRRYYIPSNKVKHYLECLREIWEDENLSAPLCKGINDE